jgi:hypothetical protein
VNRAWNLLRLKITRHCGKVKYFKVLEPQPSTGMPHFHVFLNRYVSAAWLNSALVSSGFGRIFKIQAIRDDQIFSYALKYLSKGIADDRFLSALISIKGRRFSFSRGMLQPKIQGSLAFVSVHNTGDRELLSSLLSLRLLDISISSGWYPLDGSKDFCHWRLQYDVPLLPPPPKS